MSSSLSGVPIERRRRLAATLGLFAVLFVAVGAVAATGKGGAAVTAFVVIALVVAVLLALIGWGIMRSVAIDVADRRLDAAIEQAIEAQGGTLRDLTCGCGHDHDPQELHVPDDPCGRDGGGHECSRTCDTCVFSRLRTNVSAETVPPAGHTAAQPAGRPSPGTRRPLPSRQA